MADFVPGTLKRFLSNPEAGILTTGGANKFPHSIGDIKVSWINSTDTVLHYILKDTVYFPNSPVNIISITVFADQLEDDEGSSIMTKRRYYVFTWDFGRHSIDLSYPNTRLQTMRVNQAFSSFKYFCSFLTKVGAIYHPVKIRLIFHKIPCVINFLTMHHRDILKFTIDGSCETVELLDIDINFETMVPYFKIRLHHGFKTIVTREHLSPQNIEASFQLPIAASQVREHAAFLGTDTLQAILYDQSYPSWYLEFMLNHNRLGYLPFVEMFKLVNRRRLPKKYV